jgi:hypothetical protein
MQQAGREGGLTGWEGDGEWVEGLVGILHGGEERLVVMVLVGMAAAATGVAVACSHLPHSCFLVILGVEKGEWMWSSATHELLLIYLCGAHLTSLLSLSSLPRELTGERGLRGEGRGWQMTCALSL